jgi:phosphotransferase system HPr-like phosphotransfer protein
VRQASSHAELPLPVRAAIALLEHASHFDSDLAVETPEVLVDILQLVEVVE